MKHAFSILALATTAAATFGDFAGSFRGADPFTCPGNTDNKCNDKQQAGFDFSDVADGQVSLIGGLQFSGFSCKSGNSGKRFAPRTNSGKTIGGSCSSEKAKSPSFGCGASSSFQDFSLGLIVVATEFDADLEFHYDMPDGSECKTRSSCSKSGTTVKNDQCGGAKNVTIVYPSQPSKPKTTCSVDVHTISFHCSSTTVSPPTSRTTTTQATTKATTTSTTALTTTATTAKTTTSTAVKTTSTTAVTTTSSTAAKTTSTTSTAITTTSSTAAKTTPTTLTAVTTPIYQNSTAGTTESVTASTYVTSFLTTSTVFTTLVSTITSCASTVTNCPANSVVTTIVTVPLTTTICPVTETRTSGKETSTEKPSEKSSTTIELSTTSKTSSPPPPVETLPCPSVVPACLNTFLFSVSSGNTCADNSDSACYCTDSIFISNVFDCVYAHGETAEIVGTAVLFIQGICAPYVSSNPAIATAATITSFVTLAPSAVVTVASAALTTVTVTATNVVPCTNSAGSTIAGSSSTVIVSTAITVPNVGFTTGAGSSVGVVPVTTTLAQAGVTSPTTTGTAIATGTTIAVATNSATTRTTATTGTGAVTVRPSSTGIVTVNAGGRVSAAGGLSLVVLAAMGVIAAL